MADETAEPLAEQDNPEPASGSATTESPEGTVSKREYQELNNQYLRLAADFENFRKRQAQEREHMLKYGAETTIASLLPVLDNLARGQQSLSESSDAKTLYKSFELLTQQLLDALQQVGLQKMTPEGEVFDPERHEALSQVENPDVPEYTILQVYQDGYLLHDRVIRPARVVVSTKPAGTADSGNAPTDQENTANFPPEAGGSGKGSKDNPFKQPTTSPMTPNE